MCGPYPDASTSVDAASPAATLGRYRAPEFPPARARDRGGTQLPAGVWGGASGGGHADVSRVTWDPGNVPDVLIRHVRTSVPAGVHRDGHGDIRWIGDMRPQAPTYVIAGEGVASWLYAAGFSPCTSSSSNEHVCG